MQHIGHGVVDGEDKPVGFWPVPLSHALKTAARYEAEAKKTSSGRTFAIVNVYIEKRK